MAEIYGLPNPERTKIITWRTLLPIGTEQKHKWFIMPGGGRVSPQPKHFLAAGWVLKVVPECDKATHKLLETYTIGTDTATQDKVALTVEELEAKVQTKRNNLTCSLLQLKKALNLTGKRGAVNSEMANADQDTRDAFECASIVKRTDLMVVAFGAKLGMTETDMDEFIIMAAGL